MKKAFLGLTLFGAFQCCAQWSMNPMVNTPICTDTNKQIDMRMIEDGKGGAFLTWKDYRVATYNPDVYIQRVNAKGVTLWTTNGVPLCTDSADQSTPNIIGDMHGGAIVAWSDWRNGTERDLYAQRVDSNGNIVWISQGANVSNLSPREHSEKLVSDGHGGVIVVFEKQFSHVTFHWEIWAQRLDSAGNKMWGPGGIALSQSINNRRNHKAQKDRNGGAIIAWQELDSVSNTYNIIAQRVDAAGNLLWGQFGKTICGAAGDQINAKIDPDSINNGAFLVWQDTRNTQTTTYDIYASRVDSNGNSLWAPNGNPVCISSANQSALDLMSISTTNEAIITWKDNRNGNYDIYAQKLDMNGNPKWANNGMVICNSPFDQINPNIATDENKGAVIVWQDISGSDYDIRAQRIDNGGNIKWSVNGEWVSTAIGEQSSAKNCTDGKGGSIFAWQDNRGTAYDIYAHHLFASGSPNEVENIVLNNDLRIYPNPISSWLNVDTREVCLMECYNPIGQMVYKTLLHSGMNKINLFDLHNGLYQLKFSGEKGVFSTPLLKQ